MISIRDLVKEYKVYERKTGFMSTIRNLVDFNYKILTAVNGISFSIEKGEMVGFIGPNGAGKSTTVKLLCGILQPTRGEVSVDGLNPARHRKKLARNLGVVFGQKTQLIWDLPVMESFLLLKDIYIISDQVFKRNLELFNDVLKINDFLKQPVRQISLGQRMKADICASLLHDPEIIYFDEPTIGLDIVVKENIRNFIKLVNREKKSTILFTTHDMDDIEQTCNRIIMIDQGKIAYDGSLETIRKKFSKEKVIILQFEKKEDNFRIEGIPVTEGPDNKKILTIPNDPERINEIILFAFNNYKIRDITIDSPKIESIIRDIYNEKISLDGINDGIDGVKK